MKKKKHRIGTGVPTVGKSLRSAKPMTTPASSFDKKPTKKK